MADEEGQRADWLAPQGERADWLTAEQPAAEQPAGERADWLKAPSYADPSVADAAFEAPAPIHEEKLPRPDEPKDSFLQAGMRLIENIPAQAKEFAGGLIQKLVELPAAPGTGFGFNYNDPGYLEDVEARKAMGQIGPDAALAKSAAEIAAAARDEMKRNAPNLDPDSIEGYAYETANAIIQMVPTLATAVITRSPNAGLVVMGTQVSGQKYGEARGEGRTPEQAAMDAQFYTASEILTEKIPLGILTKEGGKFWPRVLKAIGAESIGEGVNQAAESAYDKVAAGKDVTWGEFLNDVKRAMIIGGAMGGTMAAGMHPLVRERNPLTLPSNLTPEERATADRIARAQLDPSRQSGILPPERLTPEDIASPIPSDLIAEGKSILAGAAPIPGGEPAIAEPTSAIAAPVPAGGQPVSPGGQSPVIDGLPEPGSRVTVAYPDGKTVGGQVVDTFEARTDELGIADHGVKIALDDGRTLEELRSTMAAAGLRVTPERGNNSNPITAPITDQPQVETPAPTLNIQSPQPIPVQPTLDTPLDVTGLTPVESLPRAADAPPPAATNLADLGMMGGAITANMYDALWAKVEAGKTAEAGQNSVYLQVAKRIRESGGALTREDLPELFDEVRKISETKSGMSRSNALWALVLDRVGAPPRAAGAVEQAPLAPAARQEQAPPAPARAAGAPGVELPSDHERALYDLPDDDLRAISRILKVKPRPSRTGWIEAISGNARNKVADAWREHFEAKQPPALDVTGLTEETGPTLINKLTASREQAVKPPPINGTPEAINGPAQQSETKPSVHHAGYGTTAQQHGILTRVRKSVFSAKFAGRLRLAKRGGRWALSLRDGTPEENEAVAAEVNRQTEHTVGRSERGRARGAPVQKGPEGIRAAIARAGGITDPGGELKAMGLDRWHVGKPGMPRLVVGDQQQGADMLGGAKGASTRSPDYRREWAIEHGYLPENASIDDLYEALRKDDLAQNEQPKADADQQQREEDVARAAIRALGQEIHQDLTETDITAIMRQMVEQGQDASAAVSEYTERQAIEAAEAGAIETKDDTYADIPFDEVEPAKDGQAAEPAVEGPPGKGADQGESSPRGPPAGEPAAPVNRPPTASWVIREKATGKVIMETFDRKKVDALNTDKYEAVPIQEHLASLNKKPPATDKTSAGDQRVIPGAERISDKALAERKISEKLKPKQPQQDADEGLFDTGARKQTELFSRARTPTFFSALTRAIEAFQQPKASAEQWAGIIRNLTSKGVKQDEIDWSGVQDWLIEQKGPVSKNDLIGYLRANEVKVEEVTKGGELKATVEEQAALMEALEKLERDLGGDLGDPNAEIQESADSLMTGALNGDAQAIGDLEGLGVDERLIEPFRDRDRPPTKFGSYTLPGGENYRELLLTLPEDMSAKLTTVKHPTRPDGFAVMRGDGSYILNEPGTYGEGKVSYWDTRELARKWGEPTIQNREGRTFRSGHWDEPNVLAHVRFNERTDADGKRVLFIEEIQSDWHQKGRRQGYKQTETRYQLLTDRGGHEGIFDTKERAEEVRRAMGVATGAAVPYDTSTWTISPIEVEIEAGVPDAPFKTQWPDLAFKRALRWAAENGFDKVAWTTGEQQAERYDLSKHIDSIAYQRRGELFKIRVSGKNGETVYYNESADAKTIENTIGKEMAEKISKGEGKKEGDLTHLEGLDLKVGGEGMKAFYDKMLPSIANKIGKKFGATVGRANIQFADNATIRAFEGEPAPKRPLRGDVHVIDVTDAMRESVMQGQPLWARARADFPAKAVTTDLAARLKQVGIGDAIALKVVEEIRNRQGKATGAEGRYFDRMIEIALGARDQGWTLDHEIIHALKDMGLFRPMEWRALERAARADTARMAEIAERYPELSPEGQLEEAIADMFADWAAERGSQKGFVRTAFDRIRAFFKALGEALRGNGFTSVDSVFQGIERGEVGTRNMDAEPTATDKFSRPRPAATKPTFDNPESERRYQDGREGAASQDTLVARTGAWFDVIKAGFTRHYIALPNTAKYADVKEQLRKLEAAPQSSKEQVIRYLKGLTKEFTPDDLDLFTRKVILDDLSWEAKQEHDLPFAMTPEDVTRELAKIDQIIDENPKVRDALRQRKLAAQKVAGDMERVGILSRDRTRNPTYYRHQVLEHARAQVKYAQGVGNKLKSPHWAWRLGSTLDINANFLEAELDWMHKAFTGISVANTIEWIKTSKHNVRDEVIAQAKASNAKLLQKKLDDDGLGQGTGGPLHDQLKVFRQRIAIGMGKVRKAIENGEIHIPEQYEDAAASLTGEADNDADIFPFLAWIMENNEAGANGAMQTFKAIAQRKAWIKDLLGDRYADTMNVGSLVKRFAPEGYVAWQPDEGKLLYTAKTLPEHVIDKIQKLFTQEGSGPISADDLRAAMDSVRTIMTVGGNKFELVIPEDLATTLNSLRDENAFNIVDEIAKKPVAMWKQWVLINPRRVIKYNINNLSGDLDAVIAGNPRALKQMPRAIKELYAVMLKGQAPSNRYREAVARGVFDSGLTVQEIPDINYLTQFEHLFEKPSALKRPDKFMLTGFAKVWRALKQYTQFRENWMRYAAYLDYADRIDAGENVGYGAAHPDLVDAITDPKDKAALLARELVGDYGNVTHFGQGVRKRAIPFYSWMEINTKRYWRLSANAFGQGVGEGFKTTGLIGATMGVKTTAYLALRMWVVYGLVQVWNNLFFGDDEDELDPEARARLHVNLGRDSDGKVRSLRFQGALSDYLAWIGFEDVVHAMAEIEKGRGDYTDILTSMAKAPVNKLGSGLTPVIKLPLEVATGKSLYPDVFRPVPIRDNWRHLFRTFSAEHEYDLVFDKPSRGYGHSLTEAIVSKRDPGENAYNRIKGMTYNWLEKEKGQSGGGFTSNRANALYDWRQAKKFGDETAAANARDRMKELGIKGDDLRDSIKRAHPLGALSLKDRSAFLRTLTDDERDMVSRATQWYRETFAP